MLEQMSEIDQASTEDISKCSSVGLYTGESFVTKKDEKKSSQSENEVSQIEKWRLKKPEVELEISESKKYQKRINNSMDVSSSMREFLQKEKQCKSSKTEGEGRDKDDTFYDISALDKNVSDIENATDEEIASLLEELSIIAGGLTPNSALERIKSGNSSKNPTDEEKSVEELLQEAEKLVRVHSELSRSISKSNTLVPDEEEGAKVSSNDKNLEENIFQLIEQQIETEKNQKSPRIDKKKETVNIPAYQNTLKPPSTLELQKRRFEEQKVEVSSSSDLDDPIEKHSKCEDLKNSKKESESKENLRKEITDVDKDFFDDLLLRSKRKAEGKMSGSSSFGQEDFSHFLKILQNQTEPKFENFFSHSMNALPNDPKNSTYPEKEISEILEKELKKVKGIDRDLYELDSNEGGNAERFKKLDKHWETSISSRDRSKQSDHSKTEVKKVGNTKNELYTVGLTPRLELFADTIPKLIAEKSNENEEKEKQNPADTFLIDSSKTSPQTSKPPERKLSSRSSGIGPSRSYDQLPKSISSFRSSLDDVRANRTAETLKKAKNTTVKPRNQNKTIALMPNFASKVKFSVKPTVQKPNVTVKVPKKPGESTFKSSVGAGDYKRNFSKDDWQILCHEEKHKNVLLKNQIDSEAKMYKQQIENIRTSFEQELFELKKQNIMLKAKIDELSLNNNNNISSRKIVINKSDSKILLLEKEVEKQENLIKTYENENKKLITEIKKLEDVIKNQQFKEINSKVMGKGNENEKLNDIIKDLKEEILKLNFELSDVKDKYSDVNLKYDDMIQQNSLVQEELNMYKEQLITKDKYITDKLHLLNAQEVDLKRKMEEMKGELQLKTEKLKQTTVQFDKYQQAIEPLEKELLELRSRDQILQEKLQISKSHVEREKVLTQKLKDQVILDNKKILDLNRQVREMERILKRKNPDSVSALILTAKSDHEKVHLEKVKLLEDRIASLEGELKAREEIGQEKLVELQQKFGEMKEKYMGQVSELERKLEETRSMRKILSDKSIQTISKHMEHKCVETKRDDREKVRDKVGPKSQNPKEDTHLIATIRGLKLEMNNKDKSLTKLTKDLQELQKSNRRLQKEKEKLTNDRKHFKSDLPRPASVTSDLRLRSETNDVNSNIYQNGHSKLSNSCHKLYDPLQYSENSDNGNGNNTNEIKRLQNENVILKEELNKISKDFMILKNKRLHDLNILQEEHEREIATLVKEYSVKFGDSKIIKLQGQINTQIGIITQLKLEIDKLRDYKEQVLVLNVEREHLENKVKLLNDKIKYLSTPGTEQLQLLQDKVTMLQERHESREMTLQNLIRDLLRNKNQCHDCYGKGDKGKNKLCYYRQELDHILAMLRQIAN